jgi:hypothetical protein
VKRISAALAVAVALGAAVPAAADPGVSGRAFYEQPSSRDSAQDVAADETVAIILGGVLLFVVIAAPLFGADSRPAWRNVDRKARFRMVGSMRPEDWPPSEFRR